MFLDGYRTYTQRVYLAPDHTFKFSPEMEKLPAGEAPSGRRLRRHLPPADKVKGAAAYRAARGQPPSRGLPPPRRTAATALG